jgi:dihydroorotase
MSEQARVLLIAGGDIVEPTGSRRADVLVVDGAIAAVGENLEAPTGADVLDASGCLVGPGLVDVLTGVGGPGLEEAETIETAARAAAVGGYTTLVANSDPASPLDSVAALEERRHLAVGPCRVLFAASLTVDHRGERLAPIGELAAAGVTVFTDGGSPVADTDLLRHALEYGAALGVSFALHPEDPSLGRRGVVHEGPWAGRLGLPGRPALAETLGTRRLVGLAALTGARILVHRVTTAEALAVIGDARAVSLPVTASVCPHHLVLTDADCAGYDTSRRLDPPLRPLADVEGLRAGLHGGAVGLVASDHRPHTPQAKELPFDQTPAGAVGLETALAVILGELDQAPERLFEVLCRTPAGLAGLEEHGRIEAGAPADLCVVDPGARWTVQGSGFESRSTNTAFEARQVRGRVRHTVCGGTAVVIDGEGQW